MEKSSMRGGEPKSPMESSPKHGGYGTDKIGGGGQKEFTRGVRELEVQGKEFHHCVDKPGMGKPSRSEHEMHVKGHERSFYERKGKK